MEQWILKRVAKKETYTIGKLHTSKGYLCDTLEDRVRKGKKVKGTFGIDRRNRENAAGRMLPTGDVSA